ncbi:MAG: cytochrome B [Bacteroidia bacterium]|nr:cytochrome b/b6 domain-containing protein [Bacteroidales bacterium]NCD40542.1 cytochrome B [Bacteroidia bacterium]MDD2321991.1 cytochrome b/b6 domain-containing protein [Bacteroidales bacterium]MDD3010052.1 cytochrome b/b6 domain-containing protein [Bacteroidales bacterium]MDD3960843.1 cytochrome b/b6 domain-containing protein [Bacteroidales bacterium]
MKPKKTKEVYIYHKFERFWHWSQAALIFFLALTGFEIHSSYNLFGFETAVTWHNYAAWAFIGLIGLAIFWHFVTDQWRNYIPTTKNLKAQIEYYLTGIFRNAPHPTKKTTLSKLNPLQRLVYLGLKILIIPVMVVSGLLYMFYRYPQGSGVESLGISGLKDVAIIHSAGAFLLLVFVIVHLYLISTGTTVTSNLKAMITGYEEVEDDKAEEEKEDTNKKMDQPQ